MHSRLQTLRTVSPMLHLLKLPIILKGLKFVVK
jgi:hypothetical protein